MKTIEFTYPKYSKALDLKPIPLKSKMLMKLANKMCSKQNLQMPNLIRILTIYSVYVIQTCNGNCILA